MPPYANRAAFLDAARAPLRIDEAPIGPLTSDDQVIVRNEYVGIAPLDVFQQAGGFMIKSFPAIFGTELSGIVQEAGKNVTHVKAGQRVLARTFWLRSQDNQDTSFQNYSRIHARGVVPIPDTLSFADAAALPMSLTTAGHGLFSKNYLGLSLPKVGAINDHAKDVIVILGGASSVGAMAVQLATLAGYSVVTTASSKNFHLLASLGAKATIDYKAGNVAEELTKASNSLGTLRGIYITAGNSKTEYEQLETFVKAVGASDDVPVASTMPAQGTFHIKTKSVMATDFLLLESELAVSETFMRYVAEALAAGELKATPPSKVIGRSLEDLGAALKHFGAHPPSAEKYVVKVGQAENV